jgi:hypothetical protein
LDPADFDPATGIAIFAEIFVNPLSAVHIVIDRRPGNCVHLGFTLEGDIGDDAFSRAESVISVIDFVVDID